MPIRTDADYARELDARDDLASYRDRFFIDDPSLVYLDGNSLGRLPRAALTLAEEIVRQQWGSRLIRGWNEGWMALARRIGSKIGRLVDAAPDEIVMADSTSVNLFKLAFAALRYQNSRTRIVTDDLNFPTDRYILQAVARQAGAGYDLTVVPSEDGLTVSLDALDAAIDEHTALLALSHTAYKSGFTYDLDAVTALAHRKGTLVLWDVSHSVGAVPISFQKARADLAAGCTYKYLNAGPGAPAFLYVRQDLHRMLDNPIPGWFGHRHPFHFAPAYEPAEGIDRFLTGTPPVVSLALVEPGVDLLLEAGMARVRAKSVRQSAYFIGLWEAILAPLGFTLNSPAAPDQRGSHVSIGHPEGYRIDQALIHRMGVIPDFRTPDNLRFGITPLYTTYTELHTAARALEQVVAGKLYEAYAPEMRGVT
jgi:kynureninase